MKDCFSYFKFHGKTNQHSRNLLTFSFRKAFRVEAQKHILLYEKAASREKPSVKLNLCVLEAKELACKDNLTSSEDVSKGDPFVTVHLKSKPFEIKNTTCKARNIHPVWKETFVLGKVKHFDICKLVIIFYPICINGSIFEISCDCINSQYYVRNN